MHRLFGSALLYGCLLLPAHGGETSVKLASGAGSALVQLRCSTCHSLDYVVMNSPFLNAAQWDAKVAKMIKAFGAPIDPADAKTIGDYLKQNYGK